MAERGMTPLPPLHHATAVCPRCNAVLPEDDRGQEIDCPGCGQRIRYESFEDRLSTQYERMTGIEDRLGKSDQRLNAIGRELTKLKSALGSRVRSAPEATPHAGASQRPTDRDVLRSTTDVTGADSPSGGARTGDLESG